MKKNPIYQLIIVFYRFLLTSLYFYLTNILLVGLVLTTKLNLGSSIFYFLGLIILFPSIGALADLLKDSEWNTEFILGFKKYFKYYWQNRFIYLRIGMIYFGLLIFLLFDIYAVNTIIKNQIFMPLMLILMILVVVSLGWIIGIQSFFKIDVKNSLRLSVYASTHFAINSLMIVLFAFLLYLSLTFIPQFMVFIIVPVLIEGLIMLTKKPLQKVKRQLHIS